MVPRFELLFDCNNKLPELKKEDINWVTIGLITWTLMQGLRFWEMSFAI